MSTIFNDTTLDHKWSTAANWTDGKPDSADAVTIKAGVVALIIDEEAVTAAFTDLAALVVTGSGNLTVNGAFTSAATANWTGWLGALIVNTTSTRLHYFGTKTWGQTITINIADAGVGIIMDANTFTSLAVVFSPVTTSDTKLGLAANQTVTTLTITGNLPAAQNSIRGIIYSTTLTSKTLTVTNLTATGYFDMRDIAGAGACGCHNNRQSRPERICEYLDQAGGVSSRRWLYW